MVAREIRDEGLGRVHGVVFQGMGEPMLNLDEVLPALAVMSNPCGLAIDAQPQLDQQILEQPNRHDTILAADRRPA